MLAARGLTLLVCLAFALGGGAAQGAFPGAVGKIVISSNRSAVASGEIYSIRTDGTERADLSGSPARESDPAWSPDGTHVAFSRGGVLVVMDADGAGQVTLGLGRRPAWSPDGRRLAFVRGGAVWTSAPNGAHEMQLADAPGADFPMWSPDGTQIAFSRYPDLLDVVPASGGVVRELGRGINLGPAFGSDSRRPFTWRRDGRSLLYANKHILYSVGLDGLVHDVVLRAPSIVGDLALSPSGDDLAFSVWSDGPDGGLWSIAVETGLATQLTQDGKRSEQLLTWSPDGRQIAFARSDDRSLHVLTVRLRTARLLPAEHPGTVFEALSWSPDGKRILFATTFADDAELYSFAPNVGAQSGPLTQLTHNWAQDVDPAWSPDGSSVAFASNRTGNYEIYTMRADGHGVRRLTHDVNPDRQPSWSPDGAQIVFSSGRPATARERAQKKEGDLISHLYVMAVDGSQLRRLTRDRRARRIDGTPAWSPDGKTILFASLGESSFPRLTTIRPSGLHRQQDLLEDGYEPDWSPGRDAISFVHVYYEDEYDDGPLTEELVIKRLDGSGVRILGNHGAARWSPDGSLLASADGTVFDRHGSERGTIPAGPLSWQPVCTRSGNGRNNVLRARKKTEVVCGWGGNDLLVAAAAGNARLFGGAGSDRLLARNGRFDVIGCGPGRDTVVADRADRVGVDCENGR